MKRKDRKITAVLFIFVLLAQLAACAATEGAETSKTDRMPSVEQTKIDDLQEENFKAREIKGYWLHQTPEELMKLYAGENTGILATGLSSEKKQGLELWFTKEETIQNIELEFYSNINYPQNFIIEIYDGTEWKELVREEDFSPMFDSRFCLEKLEEVRTEGVRFLADSFAGADYLILKGIRFNVNSEKAGGKLYGTAREVVAEILGNYEKYGMTDFQRCLFLMDWIDSYMVTGAVDTDPYITLKTGIGACGNRASLMAALAKECGFESRYVNFYNWPYPGEGHTMVEIYYQNQWHLFDPSYCAYYVKDPGERNNRVDPVVASFQELRDNPQLADTGAVVMDVTDEFFLTIEREGKRDKSGYYTSPALFEGALPAGVIGKDKPMLFSASFDFTDTAEIMLGGMDDSSSDMQDIAGHMPAGLQFIGSSYYNVNHSYKLSGLEPGSEYEVEIKSLPGTVEELQVEIFYESLEGEVNSAVFSQEQPTLKFQVKAPESEGEIEIRHSYLNGEYRALDYIRIKKL